MGIRAHLVARQRGEKQTIGIVDDGLGDASERVTVAVLAALLDASRLGTLFKLHVGGLERSRVDDLVVGREVDLDIASSVDGLDPETVRDGFSGCRGRGWDGFTDRGSGGEENCERGELHAVGGLLCEDGGLGVSLDVDWSQGWKVWEVSTFI